MAGVMHALFVRHHLRPGEFWNLPPGEQVFITASMEVELEEEERARREMKQ